MKRFLIGLLCLLLLCLPALAAGSGNSLHVTALVARDGTCQMTARLELKLTDPIRELVIPLGPGATNAAVNGTPVKIKTVSGVPSVVLERETGFSGSLSLALSYTLRGCVEAENNWDLVLPLLAGGLAYSMDHIAFEVTLPGPFAELPNFSSGYFGDDVDNYMTIQVAENVISGSVDTPLRDQESLTLTMATDPALFPRTNAAGQFYPICRLALLGCAVLALGYWLIRLRWKPVLSVQAQPQAPVGVSPGDIPCKLFGDSPDLGLMILSWAQLGYLTIHMSADHNVTLHKRMDMGNERNDYENRLFRQLFGPGQMAEAASRSFQSLRQRVDLDKPQSKGMFRRKSGRVLWVRVFGALGGLFAGVGMADMLAPPAGGRVFLLIPAGLLGALGAWLVHDGFRSLFSWNRTPGFLALGAGAALVLLGLLSGCLGMAAACCLLQCLLGLLILWGGRRTEAGRQTVQSILGFRRYLRTAERKRVAAIMEQSPSIYYDFAPYALALGVDRQFAGRFETLRLPPCTWLVTDVQPGNRAPEWCPVLRQVILILRGKLPGNNRTHHLPPLDQGPL